MDGGGWFSECAPNKLFPQYARFQGPPAEARRAEAVVAKRLAQRFVLGVSQARCPETHYSPRNWAKRDLGSIPFSSMFPPSFPLPSFPRFKAAAVLSPKFEHRRLRLRSCLGRVPGSTPYLAA